MANMTFSLDAPTKKRFVDFCDSVGLSASSVITVYIKTVIRENRIPFTISADPLPNAETIAAMEEGEHIAHDPTRPRYTLSEALKELKR
jgi:DNA-damage-inducible protein J